MRSIVHVVAVLVAAAVVAEAAAAGGGPAPGALAGWDGVRIPGAKVRYAALPSGRGTTAVAAVAMRGGRILRFGVVDGELGVPLVAFDGTTDGLSADGRRLVLASYAPTTQDAPRTRFVVLRTRTLQVERIITLRGLWSFDAISPNGSLIYTIEYLSAGDQPDYQVRAIDVGRGSLLPGRIVDKRQPNEEMRGIPVARAWGRGGWAYTLYGKPDGSAFVHALDTIRSQAVCIDLPWRDVQNAVREVRLVVGSEGRTIELTQPGRGRLAIVDLQAFSVRSFRRPVAPGTPVG